MRSRTPRSAARRRAPLVLASLLVAAGSAGCASSSQDTTAEQARDSLYAVLDTTQRMLGGEFDNQDDPTARGCALALWQEGDHFPALRLGTAPAGADDAVATVSDYWEGLGYELSTSTVGEVLEVQGEGDQGEILILRVSDDAITLQGESACRPS
jgi:hypothetical protein